MWDFELFVSTWGDPDHVFGPADPAIQCRARGRVITPTFKRQDCRFVVFVQIRPSDALLSPEPGGGQGHLFTHSAVQGYTRDCGVILYLFVLYLFHFFRLNTCPPSRAVGNMSPSIGGIWRFSSNSPPCQWSAAGYWHDFSPVLAPVFPSTWTRFCLVIVMFLWFVCRRAFSAPPPPSPRHTGCTRQGFDGWFALSYGLRFLQLLFVTFSWLNNQAV